MAGFMNDELNHIKNNLTCGHCNSVFVGSDSQARKVKYEQRTVYCSNICRAAAMRNKFSTPVPNRGPCKHCGKEFFSRTAKIYCSLDCYMQSDQAKEMRKQYTYPSPEALEKIRAALRKGKDVPCKECGKEFYQKRSTKSRLAQQFCSTPCYRSYLAKRFDRWIANPQGLALPQCYDEFLDRQELECVVDGCNWKGKHLSLHMNQTHGVRASDFKRAAGFNLGTGVVSKPTAIALSQREKIGIAIDRPENVIELSHAALNNIKRYTSLEAREHSRKSRALLGQGPERTCKGCGCTFHQSKPMGRALYCSVDCRTKDYAKRSASKAKIRHRNQNGTFTWEDRNAR